MIGCTSLLAESGSLRTRAASGRQRIRSHYYRTLSARTSTTPSTLRAASGTDIGRLGWPGPVPQHTRAPGGPGPSRPPRVRRRATFGQTRSPGRELTVGAVRRTDWSPSASSRPRWEWPPRLDATTYAGPRRARAKSASKGLHHVRAVLVFSGQRHDRPDPLP